MTSPEPCRSGGPGQRWWRGAERAPRGSPAIFQPTRPAEPEVPEIIDMLENLIGKLDRPPIIMEALGRRRVRIRLTILARSPTSIGRR